MSHRTDIQGLRAIAVLLVLVYHAGLPLPGGFIGVDVFFVVSGFVITSMLLRERDRGRIRFARFYIRRFKRLAPALALVTVFTLLVSALLLSPLGSQQDAALTGLGATTFVANIVIARTTGGYFDAPAEVNPLLHTWSLSVEEQFYFLFPLLLALCWGLSRTRRLRVLPLVVVGLIALGSFVLAVAGPDSIRPPSSWMVAFLNFALGFYSPVTRAWEFAVGAVVALLGLAVAGRWRPGAIAVLGLSAVAASAVLITPNTTFPGMATLPLVVGTAMVLVAGSSTPNPVSRALSWSPMVWIGDLSYSLYLWHWPFVVFSKILWGGNSIAPVLAVALSVIPAYASYRWVETPLRVMTIGSGRIAAGFVVAVMMPPLVAAGALLAATGQGFWMPTVQKYQAAVLTPHAGETAGCDSFLPLSVSNREACTWNKEADGPPIYLVGDSHADHFSEAAIEAGNRLGRPVTISTTSNCPFLDAHFIRDSASGGANERCRTKVQGTLDYLRTSDRGVVILASADAYWSRPSVGLGLQADTVSYDPGTKLNVLGSALSSTVKELEASGHSVVLVHTYPERSDGYSWDPASCRLTDMLGDAEERCGPDMPLVAAETRQLPTRNVLTNTSVHTGSPLIDPGPTVCPEGKCSIEGEQFVRMMDSGHISVQQSEALADLFASAIR